MGRKLLACLVLVCMTFTASAEMKKKREASISWEKAVPCPKNGNLDECALSQAEVADRNMKKAYRMLDEAIGADNANTRKRLVESQRAWLVWRESEVLLCTEAVGYSTIGLTGSGTSMQMAFCGARIDEARRDQLIEHKK